MKKKCFEFIFISIVLLISLPIYNLYNWNGTIKEYIKTKQYYKLDNLIPFFNKKLLFQYGINLFSYEAIIGKDYWFFLGNKHENTLSNKKWGVIDNNIKETHIALIKWNKFFKNNGVNDFHILIGPNKTSVYFEYLPPWAQPAKYSNINAIIDSDKEKFFLDPTEFLISQKNKYNYNLYFKNDTHWNTLGAYLGFTYLMDSIDNKKLYYSKNLNLKNTKISMMQTNIGDLTTLLRTTGSTDNVPIVEMYPDLNVKIKEYDFFSGKFIKQHNNKSMLLFSPKDPPKLFISDKALNKKKVLFISDSFGFYLLPFMQTQFNEILRIHVLGTTAEKLESMVHKFKPDFVFVVVCERNLVTPYKNFFLSSPTNSKYE